MNYKKVALYTVLAIFNIYMLWPIPSAERVYNAEANSVVYVEAFEHPVLRMEDFFGNVTRLHFPWGHKCGHASGVIINKVGYILTARHVAERSGLFLIMTKGGQVYEAGLLGIDPKSDLAILQPVRGSARGFTVARSHSTTTIGAPVIHIGCPLIWKWLCTAGVVSFIDEYVVVSDAVINPGSSGGALFDIRGRLIGIASGLISPIGAYIGHSIFMGPDAIGDFLAGWGL